MGIYFRNTARLLRNSVRSLATIAPSSSSIAVPPTQALAEHQGPLRPHLQIPVKPNHGLYGFFRVKTDTNSHARPKNDGQPEYVALEVPSVVISGVFYINSHTTLLLSCIPDVHAVLLKGRAWSVAELRRKSFKDLHTLWYVLLRERNLLATQAEEKRKVKYILDPIGSQKALSVCSVSKFDAILAEIPCQCRKSMARIKAVINERRHAYRDASQLRRVWSRHPELSKTMVEESGQSILENEVEQEKMS